MGASMTDEEIASIITYTKQTFANAGSVQPAEVKRLREELGK